MALLSYASLHAGTLSCSVTTAAGCTGTVLLRMSDSINAHAELPSQSDPTYSGNVICCSGVSGLGTSCSGTFATFLKLQSVTNSHTEIGSQTNYANSACLSVGAGGYTQVGWQASNCIGYDTTLGSIESTTNAHVGNTSAYTTKICASASSTPLVQSISFSLSANSVSFGVLSSVQTRYASSTNSGDANETEAFTLQVNTNAPSGYFVTVQGDTLRYSSYPITSLGNTNISPSAGVEQFGIRATVSGSNGIVNAPYAASGFAFDASTSSASQIGYASVGDSTTATYSIRLVANIAPLTEAGPYTTSLIFVATANF